MERQVLRQPEGHRPLTFFGAENKSEDSLASPRLGNANLEGKEEKKVLLSDAPDFLVKRRRLAGRPAPRHSFRSFHMWVAADEFRRVGGARTRRVLLVFPWRGKEKKTVRQVEVKSWTRFQQVGGGVFARQSGHFVHLAALEAELSGGIHLPFAHTKSCSFLSCLVISPGED